MKVALLCVIVMACLLADSTGQGSTFDIKCGVEELQEQVITRMDAEDVKLDELQVQHHALQGKLEEVQVQNNEVQGKVMTRMDTLDVKLMSLDGKQDAGQVQNNELQEKVVTRMDTLDVKVMTKMDTLDVKVMTRMETLDGNLVSMDGTLNYVNRTQEEVLSRMDTLKGKLDDQDGKIDTLEGKVGNLEGKMDNMEGKLDDLKQLLQIVIANQGLQWQGRAVVIQRRGQYGNPADFFAKSMDDYKTGFGNRNKEFWLGLDELARLTKDGKWEMQVDLVDYAGKRYSGVYHKFRVGAGPRYELEVGEYDSSKSTMGSDVFSYHNKMAFSTKDVDQDTWGGDCSNTHRGQGGWWYQNCSHVNINGQNTGNDKVDDKGMAVYTGGQWVTMKETEMKMVKKV